MQNRCEEAIESLGSYKELSDWMRDYHKLFWDLTNTPKGLPTLINAYFDGEDFPVIRLFCEFYLEMKKTN
jgi:hypothetical protein